MSYTIAGRKVLNEHLALAIYGAVGLGTYAALSGPKKEVAKPVISGASDDESKFLQDFMAKLEAEDKDTAKH
ncbi:hypothetical protein MNV49_006114 [Pseudohyphozyma bogoriensis]|nr:hypothetical protein MNV49_006114 [Pseudohyphozyma bogoriensis]